MLLNAYFLAKFRFDTAEIEPAKNLPRRRSGGGALNGGAAGSAAGGAGGAAGLQIGVTARLVRFKEICKFCRFFLCWKGNSENNKIACEFFADLCQMLPNFL